MTDMSSSSPTTAQAITYASSKNSFDRCLTVYLLPRSGVVLGPFENQGVPPPVDGTPPLSVLMGHGQSVML